MNAVRKDWAGATLHEMSKALLQTDASIVRIVGIHLQHASTRDSLLWKRCLARLRKNGEFFTNQNTTDVVLVSWREAMESIRIRILLPFLQCLEPHGLRLTLQKLSILHVKLDLAQMTDVGDGVQEVGELNDESVHCEALPGFSFHTLTKNMSVLRNLSHAASRRRSCVSKLMSVGSWPS